MGTKKTIPLKPKVIIYILALIILANTINAQLRNSIIHPQNINKRYLEHLIKEKIDSIRYLHNCNLLINDSILYLASNYHANFMQEHKKMSHYESGFIETETPQLRAEYFGAINYGVGENVLKTYYNKPIKTKDKKIIITNTYNKLANAIVIGWVNSPGHFKNIITPRYQVTGVSVSIDSLTNVLYACQKFATIKYKYSFSESSSMFPYSTYEQEPIVTSFNSIDSILTEHQHKWGIKHDNLQLCERCKSPPSNTLTYKNGSFYLRFESSDKVKQLIQNKWDGFAVEIVEFEDYMCGNPQYYTKPSRRNKQCMLNGTTLKPLYREDLIKGFKKKKRNKKITYLSYILNADSVPFFDRFNRYKLEKFDSEYFYINLGRLPKGINGLWNHNLLYIQDKQICNVDYYAQYCGDLFMDFKNSDFISPDTTASYTFNLDTIHHTFTIPFKKNTYNFKPNDIKPFIDTLSKFDYTIDSINIMAYSSVEGDSDKNEKLQRLRAQSLTNILQQTQKRPIYTKIKTSNSWGEFYKELKRYPRWKDLSFLRKNDLKDIVDGVYIDSLEFMLEKQRKGIIDMYGTIDLTDKNLNYYILKESKWLCDTLKKLNIKSSDHRNFLKRYSQLYRYTYKKIAEQKIDTSIFLKINFPNSFNQYHKLAEQFVFYGYTFPQTFQHNNLWKSYKDQIEKSLMRNNLSSLSEEFIYNYCRQSIYSLQNNNIIKQKTIQDIINKLELLSSYYYSSSNVKTNIDKLNFNLNMLLINKCFISSTKEKSNEALNSILQIQHYYKEYHKIDACLALDIAKTLVYYHHIEEALSILTPFLNNDDILLYATPLMYQHSSSEYSEYFYQFIIKLSEEMEENKWCNLFLSNCKIPFQSFDHEKLRSIFCEKCMDKNNLIKSLYSKE